MDNEIILKRLAIIKYLYKIGVEQSKQVETVAAFSILSFHDSVEMFLKFLAESKNINSNKFDFLDYWSKIPTLTLKETMRNLNTRRVNIKHKGILPSKTDIEISRVNTTDFFDQNVVLHFNIKFTEISLSDLVNNSDVKQLLNEAQVNLESKNFKDSIVKSALAFDNLIYSYENNKSVSFNNPFFFGEDLTFNNSFYVKIKDRKMSEFVDKVKDSLDALKKAVKIISFGIDYKKYVKFDLLTPTIHKNIMGESLVDLNIVKKWNIDNAQYCIDFVIDSALKLQDFDFDIKEIENQ